MTAVQQYWLILRTGLGGIYASRLYPFLGKPEAFASELSLLSSRTLTYNPDQIERFTSAATIFSAQLAGTTKWDVLYQNPEAFQSAATLLSGTRTIFGSLGLTFQNAEAFQSAATIQSSTRTLFVRIGLDFQPFEAFASGVELVGALSSTTRIPLQSQAPEAFTSAAALLSGAFVTEGNPCGVLGPFDLCFNKPADTSANLDLSDTQ